MCFLIFSMAVDLKFIMQTIADLFRWTRNEVSHTHTHRLSMQLLVNFCRRDGKRILICTAIVDSEIPTMRRPGHHPQVFAIVDS